MTTADIAAGVRRLDKLARGLALELHNVGKADDPMLGLWLISRSQPNRRPQLRR